MSGGNERKLSAFLKEVADMRYDEFVRAEKDLDNYTTAEGLVFTLIRACTMEQLPAIKLAINRLEGKLATPVQIIYPKVFYIFPQAKSVALESSQTPPINLTTPLPNGGEATVGEIMIRPAIDGEQVEPEEKELPTLTFRQTLSKMVDYPRALPPNLVRRGIAVDQWILGKGPAPPEEQIPMVKSIVAAHLIAMANKRDIDALYELFDAIDGKLVETFEVVGEDMYISLYQEVAPFGSELNQDGIYQIEATEAQRLWTTKLGGEDDQQD